MKIKLCNLGSKEFKNTVKMCFISSLVLAYFIYMGITRVYDVIFAVSFVVLIFKYFSLDD